MTFEEKIKELLVGNGMFPHQSDEVMERIKTDEAHKSMKRRWTDSVDDYPPQMIQIVWLIAKQHALEYIDENLPKAWFRPMFAS